jgi:hypothetical protein
MLSLTIDNQNIEEIFLKEFHSNKEEFFTFIQSSYEKLKDNINDTSESDLINLQINSMANTWDNDKDKGWDEL